MPHILEDVIHCLLKYHWGIEEPERHHKVCKRTVRGSKCSSLYMMLVYRNIMEHRVQVERGEVRRICNPIKHLINPWNGVTIHHSQPVDWTVVHHHAQILVSFGVNEYPDPKCEVTGLM